MSKIKNKEGTFVPNRGKASVTVTQQYCCVVIPNFVHVPGALHAVLPPGIHWATLAELEARFAHTDHRRWLFEGIVSVAGVLQGAGCRTMYIGGSFVTAKNRPDDFDGCWDPTNVQAALLPPVLLDFDNERAAQKWEFRGEMFISSLRALGASTYLEFLQIEKETGAPVGLVGIRLRAEMGLRP